MKKLRTKMVNLLPCFVCEEKLEMLFDEDHFQPNEGSEVQVISAFGSAFDDGDRGIIRRSVICDSCLTEK